MGYPSPLAVYVSPILDSHLLLCHFMAYLRQEGGKFILSVHHSSANLKHTGQRLTRERRDESQKGIQDHVEHLQAQT